MMRIVDLSLTMDSTVSEPAPVTVEYISHEEGARILGRPLKLGPQDWPDGMAISTEQVSLTSHSGTHMDAPLHYGPVCEGRPSRSIEALPLEWLFRDGVVIRLPGDPALGPITASEVQGKLGLMGYSLKHYDIVLLETGADRLWGTPEYFTDFRGVTREATDWITRQGVKIIGVDSFGFDPPFHAMLKNYQESQDKDALWPAHTFGRKREYCQIERLARLEQLPSSWGFKVACFPIKIKNAGAGWARVVAIYMD